VRAAAGWTLIKTGGHRPGTGFSGKSEHTEASDAFRRRLSAEPVADARRAHPPYLSAATASSTAAAWPSTFTLGQTFATLPSLSIRNVVRSIPQYFLP